MSFTDTPLQQRTMIVRPDLSVAIICGDEVIELHLQPVEALQIANALEDFGLLSLAREQLAPFSEHAKARGKALLDLAARADAKLKEAALLQAPATAAPGSADRH
jgi:hypothetical protein